MKFLIILLLVIGFSAEAQMPDVKSILVPINDLFRAMEKGDSIMAHSAFFKDAMLVTIGEKEGDIGIEKIELKKILSVIAALRQEQWHEPIWDVEVKQEGNFAQVWARYAFFSGTRFSHCGIDTFQLLKTGNGWKIIYLADTPKRDGCAVPAEITKRYATK